MTNFAPYNSDMWYRTITCRAWIYLLIGVSIFGCRKEERPASVLSREQLAGLMVQLYLAEAKLNGYSIPKDSAAKLFIPFEEKLLKQYGISSTQLHETYQYYFDHPEELEKVYEVVIDSLSLRERLETTRQPVTN